jgi:hypothetical protein
MSLECYPTSSVPVASGKATETQDARHKFLYNGLLRFCVYSFLALHPWSGADEVRGLSSECVTAICVMKVMV